VEWKHRRNLNTWILINPRLIAMEGAKRGGTEEAVVVLLGLSMFLTTGRPHTRLPMVCCFFSLPSASKIKPGCTMNIVGLLLLVFNFQTVGGKCTDNKCSLHARSLPVLSSVSWSSGHMNLTAAFWAQNKHTVQLSLQTKESRSLWPQLRVCILLIATATAKGRCSVELLGQPYLA